MEQGGFTDTEWEVPSPPPEYGVGRDLSGDLGLGSSQACDINFRAPQKRVLFHLTREKLE